MSNDQNRRARLLAGNSFLLCVLISFVLVVYASAIELFRYNLTTPDGRKFQYIFDVSDPASQSAGDALSREEIVNRAMGWMLSFHKGPDDGSIESVTLRQKPYPALARCRR